MEKSAATREYYIDRLRVFAVALLIPFHTAMIFVPWDFHLKNAEKSAPLTVFNEFLGLWHMPLLFFLAGASTRHALAARGAAGYARERALRLLVPLAFGMAVIVPPQVYLERIASGRFSGPYTSYYPALAFRGVYPSGNLSWHHLWFLAYLFLFSMLALPLFKSMLGGRLRAAPARAEKFFTPGARVLIPAAFFSAAQLAGRFSWPNGGQDIIHDMDNFTLHLIVFITGYFFASGGGLREAFVRNRNIALCIGLAAAAPLAWGAGYAAGVDIPIWIAACGLALRGVATWFLLVALTGFAAARLNHNSAALKYASEAALPFYVLHQTVILTIAFYAVRSGAGIPAKFTLICITSAAATLAIYELLVRRFKPIRFLFGMRV